MSAAPPAGRGGTAMNKYITWRALETSRAPDGKETQDDE